MKTPARENALYLRQRLQQTLRQDPGYISLSIRSLTWLVALTTVILRAAPLANLQGAPLALTLSGTQLLVLWAHPSWLRFDFGKGASPRGIIFRPLADLGIALTCLSLTGGWNSPFFLFAVTMVLAPSLRYGLIGAGLTALGFSLGFIGVCLASPLGLEPAFHAGHVSSDLISTLVTPYLIALFAAFLGELLSYLRSQHDQIELLAAAQERNRLARDIHDGVAQTLFMLTMSLETGQVLAQQERAPKTSTHLDKLIPIARRALLELRQSLHGLASLSEDETDFVLNLQGLLRDYQSVAACKLVLSQETSFSTPTHTQSSHLLPMLQELIANAAQHAQAQVVQVLLGQPHSRAVSVIDDGIGFDPQQIKRGRGLQNLEDRARASGFELSLLSLPDIIQGTQTIVSWSNAPAFCPNEDSPIKTGTSSLS